MSMQRTRIFLATAATVLMAATGSADSIRQFKAGSNGVIDFDTPSMNICCSYAPKAGGGPEISCSRVQPKYWTVVLKTAGNMTVYKDPGEVPGCGYGKPMGNVLDYGQSWKMNGITCNSSKEGLSCVVGRQGFILSRAGLQQLP